jgi:glycosyltransferase involved in cell wall biosynthesis
LSQTILHIIDNDSVGGAQAILYNYLNEKKDNPKVCLFILNKNDAGYFNPLIKKINILTGLNSKIINLLLLPFHLIRLFKLIYKLNIKIINVHLPGTTILFTPFFLTLKLFKIKIYVSIYSNKSQLNYYLFKFYINCANLYCNAFLVLIYGQDELKNYSKKKIFFIPYWTEIPKNINQFSKIKFMYSNIELKKGILLLSIWRVSSDKLMDKYYEIINQLEMKINFSFKYLFIGSGDLFENTLKMKKENYWENTFFTGHQKECYSLYNNCDYYISIHFKEHISITTYNAMRIGKIVISLDSEGTQDKKIKFLNKLNDSYGLIISCNDSSSVLKTIKQLTDNPNLKNRLLKYLNTSFQKNGNLKEEFINNYEKIIRQ